MRLLNGLMIISTAMLPGVVHAQALKPADIVGRWSGTITRQNLSDTANPKTETDTVTVVIGADSTIQFGGTGAVGYWRRLRGDTLWLKDGPKIAIMRQDQQLLLSFVATRTDVLHLTIALKPIAAASNP